MTIRDRTSAALMRVGGLCMIAAGVMVVVPALAPSDRTTVLPSFDDEVQEAAATTPIDAAALALLARAAQSTRSLAWQGTQLVIVRGAHSTSAMVDIAHVPGVGSWTSVRTGATATTAGRAFEAESGLGPGGQPTDWLSLVRRHYTAVQEGQSPAGQLVTQAVLLKRSNGTPAARFFIDKDDGLIVGREIYDLNGDLLRASTFSELAVTTPAVLRAAGYSSATAVTPAATGERPIAVPSLAAWRSAGWTIPVRVHDDFELVDARASGAGPRDPVARLHLTYSDGLSSVSVFAERGRLVPSRLTGWNSTQRSSWPVLEKTDVHDQLTWSDGTRVWTVVADAPSGVVDHTVASLPHQRARDAYGQRFAGGLSRIGSWLNPTS